PSGAAAGATPSASPDGLSGALTVFAAASLQPAFEELGALFARQHPGVDVRPMTFDGSATLVTQLAAGARADVLATADERSMADAAGAGLLAGDAVPFTTNTLQVVVPAGNPEHVRGLADLGALAATGGRVVVCAPQVPCGAATAAVLRAAGVELRGASEEQNVSAVLLKVVSGDADAGLVYRTDVRRGGDGVEGVEVPEAAGAVNTYPVAVLADREAGHQEAVARAFVALLLSEEGQRVLDGLGFARP
uniref:molybdate ABC transporter substrate-binding protein n=1 Tax=Cellulomonas massiliensis TaxID=1465811 RepID=UPI00036E935D